MHGYTHVYDSETRKKTILIMEENQNFMVIHIDEQILRIKKGKKSIDEII